MRKRRQAGLRQGGPRLQQVVAAGQGQGGGVGSGGRGGVRGAGRGQGGGAGSGGRARWGT